MVQKIRIISIISLLAILFVTGVTIILVLLNGFPVKYMDLDDSGWISLNELYGSLDLGVRENNNDDQICVEIYSLKDGLPVKMICDES